MIECTDDDQMKAVKEALHVSKAPSTVVCREDEQRRVFDFVKGCMEQKKAGSLYICGCPGTGKSLSMEKVRQQAEEWAKQVINLVSGSELVIIVNLLIEGLIFHVILQEGLPCPETVSVNCTSLTKTTDIFSKVRLTLCNLNTFKFLVSFQYSCSLSYFVFRYLVKLSPGRKLMAPLHLYNNFRFCFLKSNNHPAQR